MVSPYMTDVTCTTPLRGQYLHISIHGAGRILHIAEVQVTGCADGGVCTACSAGTYSATAGASSATVCTSCLAGTYSLAGTSACVSCLTGTYSLTGTSACIDCSAGSYSLTGASACITCSAGAYSLTGASACVSCLAGTYSLTGTSACTVCPINTFSGASVSSCQACQTNALSAAGSVSQEYCYCKTGYAHVVGSYTCLICDPGTYNSQLGRMACSKCSVGLYSADYGATGSETCLACPLGQWSPEGSPSCNLCPVNSLAAATSGSQTDCTCNAGYTGPNGGVCSACAAGEYKTATGPSGCVSCPAGAYSTVAGASSATVCTSCLAGTYSATAGASSASVCTSCLAGTYSTNATTCITCPANSNSPNASSSVSNCTCSSGYANIADVCTAVIAQAVQIRGTLTAVTTDSSPEDIAAAISQFRYQIAAKLGIPVGLVQVERTYLNSGRALLSTEITIVLTISARSTAELSTIAAATADLSTIAGLSGASQTIVQGTTPLSNLTCSACPANSYHAQGQCVSCMNNTVSVPGSLACQCRAGFTGSPDACQACPAGTYKRMAGTSACRVCQANSMSDAASALCRCNAGYTGNTGDVCVACVAGKYKNVTGSAACVECAQRRNSVVAATNVTNCICDIAYTQVENAALTFDVVYAQACVSCEIGKFKNITGVQACTTCAQNQSSVAASSVCVCVPGFTAACVVKQYSNTFACARFFALTNTPSFASVSTRMNAAVGSAMRPTYNALGGPNGKGHVSFDRTNSQYLDAGTRTLNIATNGGFTIVSVVRFTGSGQNTERIVDLGSGAAVNNILIMRENGNNVQVIGFNGAARAIDSGGGTIVQNSWQTITWRYSASTKAWEVSINGVVAFSGTASAALADRTLSGTYIGKSHWGPPFLNGDVAGCFVVDEYLNTDAIAAVIDSMAQGVDLMDGGPCYECEQGTYKDWLGSQPCTTCPANSYTPGIRSTALVNCTCNIGATGPNGGPCPSCAGGKYKDVTGTSPCLQCSANFYSTNTSAATSCTQCPLDFQSTAVSVSIVDCCDPNTTIIDGLLNALSSNTKARWSLGYVLSVSSPPMFGYTVTSASVAPTYSAGDGFNGQPFLRFSKTSTTTGHQYLAVGTGQVIVSSGLTIVTVVRFTENMKGVMLSMQQQSEFVGFEVSRSSGLQFCVCALTGGNECSNFCTDAAVPTNVWLQVSYTYNPSITNKQLLKVSYVSGGSTVVLSKTSTVQILSLVSPRKYGFGYSAGDCSGNQPWLAPKAEAYCDRANFEVAGFYMLQFLATDGDVAAILQHIAYNKVTSCLCNAGFGGSGRSDCKSCAPGSYKSEAASVLCTACPVNMFSVEVQAVSNNTCSACPQGSVSIPGESICFCTAGFTGPDGGPCVACEAGKFKNWRNSSACPVCPANSDSIPGTSLCPCNRGYLGPLGGPCVACAAGKYKDTNDTSDKVYIAIVATTVCARVISLTPKPSFASISTRSNAGVGSAILPTHNALGGPNGKGHVSFDRTNSQYLDAGSRTFNIASNSGFTVMTIVRFTGTPANWERILDMGSGTMYMARVGTSTDLTFRLQNAGGEVVCGCGATGVITQNSWLTIVSSYRSSNRACSVIVNGVVFTGNSNTQFTDRTVSGSWIGRSWYGTDPYLTADIAGLVVVDEFLDTTTSTAITNAMIQGVDLTSTGCAVPMSATCTTCPANSYEPDVAATAVTNCTCNTGFEGGLGGPCTACALGKYKDNNESVACLPCPVDTYIDVNAYAYCKACPQFTTSPIGSTSIAACVCKLGYTGGGGAGPSDPLSTLLTTTPAYLMTSAEAWDAANSRFTDLSGNGRHGVLNWGTVSVGSVTGNGAGWSIPFAGGPTSTSISWPSASVPSTFTICSITRYSGATKASILQCSDLDWLHGHINWYGTGYAGGTLYSSGAQPGSQFGGVTPNTNWVAMCGRNIGGAPATITNGVQVSEQNAGRGNCQLSINRYDSSDWQLSRLYVWNRHLSNTEFAEAAAKLQNFVALQTPSCSACAIGKYKDAIGSALCSYCPLATFSAATNATSIDTCAACPGNSTSLFGSASKDYCQCNTGFVHQGGGCAACLPGTYNPRLAEIACSNCTVGTSSLNYGATSNETCASCSGTEYSQEGSPFCEPCPPNSVAPAKSSRIEDCGCTFGYTGPTESLCVKCAPGGYKNITGDYLCETCPVNSYSLSGATALTACFCNPGYTGAYGPLCVACVLGKYKSVYGSAACSDCPANTYADRTGQTVCTSCVNTSASAVGAVSVWNCTCNAGYKGPTYDEVAYHDNFARSCGGMRSSACATTQSSTLTTQVMVGVYDFLNPANFANDNSSATFSTTAYGTGQWWRVDFERRVTVQAVRVLFSNFAFDTLYVLVGDANSSTANLICASVAVNASSTDWATATCASALTGRYLYVRNSIASQVTMKEIQVQGTEVLTKIWPDWCEKCPLGTYKSVTGSSACVACPSNRFSATLASTSISACLSCPSNSVAATGSDQCACDAGFSGPANACTACGSDTFKTQVGASTCEICPANSVIASNASTSAMPCTCLSGYQPG